MTNSDIPEVMTVVSLSWTNSHFFLSVSFSFSLPGSSDGGGSDVPPLFSGSRSQRPHSGADRRRLRLHFWPQHLPSAGSLATASGSTRPQAGRRRRVTIFHCAQLNFSAKLKFALV